MNVEAQVSQYQAAPEIIEMVGVVVAVGDGSGVGGTISVRVGVRVGRDVLVGTRVAVAVDETGAGVAVGSDPIPEHAQSWATTANSAAPFQMIRADRALQLKNTPPAILRELPLLWHAKSDYIRVLGREVTAATGWIASLSPWTRPSPEGEPHRITCPTAFGEVLSR